MDWIQFHIQGNTLALTPMARNTELQRPASEAAMPKSARAMEQSLQRLRHMIISGQLGPGEQVRQEEMALQFGVSRMPLREALHVLAQQGLLVHRRNQGYFVAKRAPAEVAQIVRMLHLLETELMNTMRQPPASLAAALKKLNLQMHACVNASDWTPLIALNREFHFRIFDLSPNKLILEEVARLWALADAHIAARFVHPGLRAQTVAEHDEIIAALAAQDRVESLAALNRHREGGVVGY
jgi:DNA-binding GntR family transcriptional regulator